MGVDLTPLFVETATKLCAATGLSDTCSFLVGSGTDLPVTDGAFDLALLMHVGMNIEDKPALFREAYRALAAGGTLAIFDVMRGPVEGEMCFPVPWSSVAETSFVVPPTEYQAAAEAAGFETVGGRDRTEFAKVFFDKVGKMIAKRGGPPPLGIHLLMGDTAGVKIENYLKMLHGGLIGPQELIFHKPR
jgi:ubiquinone/menaquinone biosynthesis C-methylase UbiE